MSGVNLLDATQNRCAADSKVLFQVIQVGRTKRCTGVAAGAVERISKPPFERLASNLRSVLIKEVISYGMYKEG